MTETCALILLPHLQVHNANAVSGHLSWGFPPPTAFTGFAHALERRLETVRLGGIGIVCHRFDPQVYRPPGRYEQVFRLSRHPYIAGWKKFKDEAAALIEEGRAHLEVSLLIEVLDELDEDERDDLAGRLSDVLGSMRLAGGSLRCGSQLPEVIEWPEFVEEQRKKFRKLRYRLLPGFTLVEREDLLLEHLNDLRRKQPEASPLEVFLDLLALHVEPEVDEETGATHWQVRPRSGWLVPLPVGYGALSPLHGPGEVANTRDPETPFCFVESLYTIGQWLSPHRLTRLHQLLWRPEADEAAGLYLCRNRYAQLYEEDFHGEKD